MTATVHWNCAYICHLCIIREIKIKSFAFNKHMWCAGEEVCSIRRLSVLWTGQVCHCGEHPLFLLSVICVYRLLKRNMPVFLSLHVRGTPVVSQSLSGWRWCIPLWLLISALLWRLSPGWDRSSTTLVHVDFLTQHFSLAFWTVSDLVQELMQVLKSGSVCIECPRWSAEDSMSGWSPEWTSGR